MTVIFKWFYMLSKRLYKKPSYIAILVLIPMCVGALVFASSRESGFVKVILAQEDNSDPITESMVSDFLDSKSLIQFSVADSSNDALDAVKSGKADMAWIFLDDMENRLKQFVATNSNREAIAKVIVRESTVFTRISQEKLTASLYKYCSKAQYLNRIRTQIPKLDSVDDNTLNTYFDNVTISKDLFKIESLGNAQTDEGVNYSTAPLRGLLAVAICICAIAAAIFHLHDEKSGTFSMVKENLRGLISFACIVIAALNITLVVYFALLLSNLDAGLIRELFILLLYALTASAFAFLMQEVFTDIKIYTATIPLFAVAMLAACPIFVGVKSMQYLFPPTYFIHAFYDNKAILNMAFYTVALLFISFIIMTLKKLLRRTHN